MSNLNESTDLLEAIASVLLRCIVLAFLFLLLWVVADLFFLSEQIHAQGKWFGLSPHEVDVINYGGMALFKICVWLFFLLPYISIRLVLRKKAI